MKARLLTATAVLALAAGALTACTPKAGAAAIVGDTRISSTEVGKYVTREGPSPDALAQAAQQGQELLPKSTVVTYLVQQQVFTRALAKTGGVPSDDALNQLHDKAAQTLLGATQTGSDLDRSLTQNIGKSGFTSGFGPVVLRTIELEQALIDRLHASSVADLSAAVKKAGIQVEVNPRYGAWDTANLDVQSGAAPSFLTLVAPETTTPTSTPPAG